MKYTNILLIDDDYDDQDFFEEALKEIPQQFTFHTADNGRKAFQILEQLIPHPEIIFLDWNMPIMNGQEFLTELKKLPPLRNIPVVILSTTSHAEHMELGKQLGAELFLTKPNNFQELVRILSVILSD